MSKNTLISFTVLFILTSCSTQKSTNVANKNQNKLLEATVGLTGNEIANLNTVPAFDKKILQVAILDSPTDSIFFNTPTVGSLALVNLQMEMVSIFDPQNNKCECNDKIKKKLKKIPLENGNGTGFVPKIIQDNIKATKAYLLSQSGSKILAHSFTYIDSKGRESKLLYASDSPTKYEFSETNYMMSDDGEYNMFIYSLDCSGYISAAVNASGGIGGNAIESAIKLANDKNNSMVVVGGIMNSPLYQAYKGEGEFRLIDKSSLIKRIAVLNSILTSIRTDERIDTNEIKISPNYQIVLASNTGESSFNGEGRVNGTGTAGMGIANFSAKGSLGGAVNRMSRYKNYNTYIIDTGINVDTEKITVLRLKTLITALDSALSTL